MKSFLLASILLFSFQSFATVDGETDVWIVTQSIYEETEFSLKQVPLIGCYGLPQGPQLTQFVEEYQVPDSVGCGMSQKIYYNINALSCAQTIASEESEDFLSFKKITLDISKCTYKDNKRFITLVRTAAARNFPQSKNGKYVDDKEVELILIK